MKKINISAQTWRFSPGHKRNAGQERRAPTLGSYHSGARPLELDFKFMFQVAYIVINLFLPSGGRRVLDRVIETSKSPQEGKKVYILCLLVTVIMTIPDYNLYFWSSLQQQCPPPFKYNVGLNPVYFLIVLTSLNKHNSVELLFTQHSDTVGARVH